MENKSVFEQLFEINVNEHVERKNGLQYLPWAYAWAEVKKLFPESTYKVYESENGCIYHMLGKDICNNSRIRAHRIFTRNGLQK